MTTATIAVAELAEKGADIDVLHQMFKGVSAVFGTVPFGLCGRIDGAKRKPPGAWPGRSARHAGQGLHPPTLISEG